jgi:hypothetical protein
MASLRFVILSRQCLVALVRKKPHYAGGGEERSPWSHLNVVVVLVGGNIDKVGLDYAEVGVVAEDRMSRMGDFVDSRMCWQGMRGEAQVVLSETPLGRSAYLPYQVRS